MNSTSLKALNNYLSLVKFSHTIFALPFAVIGYFIAIRFTSSVFDLKLFGLIILCMVFARSAAMAFNRYIDKHIDAANERTAIREIPSGAVKPTSAFAFVLINCFLFIATTYFINTICFYLSPVALAVVLGYSFTKRFTALCHLVLGVGLSLAPIGAYLAVTGAFNLLPLLFSFAVLFWVSGFDIIYALQDEEFDKSKKLKSIPVVVGKTRALNFSSVLHIISASFIIYAGIYANFGMWYWSGTLVFTGLLLYQHTIVKPNDLSKVNIAFFTTNGIASVIFSTFVLIELYVNR
jgi:4-hydroxybenzoate polyprenyltransferase